MRNLSDREVDLLQSDSYRIHFRVYFEDAEGSMVEYTDFEDGRNWVKRIEVSDSIDNPSKTIRFEMRRNWFKNSLSTLMKDSPYNVIDDEYKPKLMMGREFLIEIALTELNQNPQSEWWRVYERGYIDSIRFDSNPIRIDARCPSARLLREYIREERKYGTESGEPVENEMQQILNDNNSSDINLVVPQSPGWNIYEYLQRKELVYDALRELAHQIGWEVKYRYSNQTEDIELMFYEPDRQPEEVTWIFTAGDYKNVSRLEMDMAEIRNFVRIVYSDINETDEDGNEGKRMTIERFDQDSIDEYGEIFMEISEASNSNINTETEAIRLAENCLHDLKDPKANQEIETMFFFPAQLHDMFEFEPNGVHYDHEQRFGVVSYRHVINLEEEEFRSYFQTHGRPNMSETGNPIGLHKEWFKKEARPGLAKGNRFFPPSQPVNVTTSTAIRGVIISYNLNPEEDLDGYKVYCSDEEGFNPNNERVVAQGRSTQWNVTRYYDENSGQIENMSSGETYYLRVRAYDENGNLSEVSDEVSEVAGQADAGDLPDGVIGTDKLENFSVTEPKLATDSVSNDKIQDNSVDKDKTQGHTGTFEDANGNTVTVENGLITDVS